MGFGFVVLGALSTRGSDPFHVCKYGIGRHFCGSALVLLASWNTWGAAALNFDERMTRAFDDFLFCCSVELKGTPHCKSFTRDGLHFDRETSFPWAGWKGSDTMLVLRWMVRLIRYGIVTTDARSGTSLLSEPPGPQQLLQFQKDVLQAILDGACSMVRFFQILYHSGAWLDRKAARGVALNVNMFCASYYFLAGRCQQENVYAVSTWNRRYICIVTWASGCRDYSTRAVTGSYHLPAFWQSPARTLSVRWLDWLAERPQDLLALAPYNGT